MQEDSNTLRDWLSKVDTSTANVTDIEQQLMMSLSKLACKPLWQPIVLGPLTEPADMGVVADVPFSDIYSKIQYIAGRCDTAFSSLADANNALIAEIEATEKTIADASDGVQTVTSMTNDQESQYSWVSDTFNNNAGVDLKSTTALVDTDYGEVTLSPLSMDTVEVDDINLNSSQGEGIPGCNMLVMDIKNASTTTTAPDPSLETSTTTELSSITDNTPTTWFETERNFIPKKQSLRLAGRALVYELGATVGDVLDMTKGYDWKAIIKYPDGRVLAGDDGAGIYIAEFIETTDDPTSTPSCDTTMQLELNLSAPQEVSEIRVNPYTRSGQGAAIIDSLSVVADGHTIVLAQNVNMSVEASTVNQLQQEVLRRTGTQSVGVIFQVPTNRPISKVVVDLRGRASAVTTGLAHAFREEEIKYHSTSRFLFISSSSDSVEWQRLPISTSPTSIGVSFNRGNSPADVLTSQISSLANTVGSLANLIGGALGKALGGAGAIGGLVGDVVNTVGGLWDAAFGHDTTESQIGSAAGYDIFTGFRSCVAVRDVSLLRVQYADSSEFISNKLVFSRNVTKVGLIVEGSIPENWQQGSWITYYLSTDGYSWVEVTPLSDTNLEASYIMPVPGDSVYLRAVIIGNHDDLYHTPKIKNYALMGLPG